MRVGVTGGAGFIGGWVCRWLTSSGYDVLVFDHHRPIRVGIEFEQMLGDVRDPVAVTELAAHVDGVIHLAAVLGTQETISNPRPAAETNVLGTLNVLDACRQYGLPLVYAGVGNHWMRNSYSTTKTCAERLVQQYRETQNLRAAIVRPVNAYGPGQRAAAPFAAGKVRKIMPAFICRALCGMPIEVYGDGEQISDMVHVSDVARVFVVALEHCASGLVPSAPVEVGPADHVSVNAIAKLVVEEVGSGVPIVHLPMRPGEQPGAVVTADTGTLAQIGMDARAFEPLTLGIAETVSWFRGQEGITWDRPQ